MRNRYPLAVVSGLMLAAAFPKIGVAGLATMFGGLESIQHKQFESTQSLRGRLLAFRNQVLGSLEILPTTAAMPLRDRAPNQEEVIR